MRCIFPARPHLIPGLNSQYSCFSTVEYFSEQKWGHDALNCKCMSHSWSIFNTLWFQLIASQYCWEEWRPVLSTESAVFESTGRTSILISFNSLRTRWAWRTHTRLSSFFGTERWCLFVTIYCVVYFHADVVRHTSAGFSVKRKHRRGQGTRAECRNTMFMSSHSLDSFFFFF